MLLKTWSGIFFNIIIDVYSEMIEGN